MPSLLLVLESADRVVIPLDRSVLTIGRLESNDICLPHGTVSKEHASIVFEDRHWVVCDIGSTNGTHVNGERVKQSILKHQDIVHFGEYRFFVDLKDGRPLPGMGSEVEMDVEPPLREPSKKPPSPFGPPRDMGLGTTMMLAPSSAQRIVSEGEGMDFAFWAFVTGCIAPVCPLIPIVLGHLASDTSRRSRLYRRCGLFFGYLSLLLWILGVAYYFGYLSPSGEEGDPPVETRVLPIPSPPVVRSGMELLNGLVTWAPYPDAQGLIFSGTPDAGASLQPPKLQKDRDLKGAVEDFLSTWRVGAVFYEPDPIHIEPSESKESIRFVIEDCFTPATFSDYNSTMIPEKKPVIGPFYLGNFEKNLFYIRTPRLTSKIAKFNNPEFSWRMAMRGVEASVEGLALSHPEDFEKVRWVALVKPAMESSRLVLPTKEGDTLRTVSRIYNLDVFPAEVIAEIFYTTGIASQPEKLVQVRLNSAVFKPEEQIRAKNLVQQSFRRILANRPESFMEVPGIFQLEEGESFPAH